MGYDIYAVSRPGTKEEIASKRSEWRRLLDEARAEGVGSLYESDHPKALAALAADREADRLNGYFRLNVWGMRTAREELVAAGVMVQFDHTPYEPHECDEDPEDGESECSLCLSWVSQVVDGPGIPIFKVCSNDGWVINPFEIQTGFKLADSLDSEWRDGLTDYVREFVEYLEAVAATGGCRVR